MSHNVGRIVSIDDDQFTSYAVHQGIDKSRQSQYDNSPYYYGSNGTYASNIRSERCITMKVFVYDDDYEKGGYIQEYDVLDNIRDDNGMQRLSSKMFDTVKSKLEGKKIMCDLDSRYLQPGFFNVDNIDEHTVNNGKTIKY